MPSGPATPVPGHQDEAIRQALAEQASDLYEDAPCGYLSTRPDGAILKVNRTFLQWTGFTRAELLDRRRFPDLLTTGDDAFRAPELAIHGIIRDVDIRCSDGSLLPVLLESVLKRDADGRPLVIRTTVFNATDRTRYERELQIAREREAVASARTERLQRLTETLAARLSPDEIAAAVVAELSGATDLEEAQVALLDERGERVRLVSSASDADTHMATRWEEVSLEQLPPAVWAALGQHRPHFREPQDDGGTAQLGRLVMPLTVAGRAAGAVVVRTREVRPFSPDERAYLFACARQCEQSLDRAALLAQTNEIARVLQQSLLESSPLGDPRVRIGAHYQPAVEGMAVGGDWHDAFAIGERGVGLVVGDVVGRGILAASAMGQLRSATRALGGAELGGPADVLTRLDAFASRLPLTFMATLAYAELDLESGIASYMCAGHPPPVLVAPGRDPVVLWDGRSLPLGVAPDRPRPQVGQVTLVPGARFITYTDGLVERSTESIDRGLQRLLDALVRLRDLGVQELTDALVEQLAGKGELRDDVCVVCVDYVGPRAAVATS